jgi:hypothetical protein
MTNTEAELVESWINGNRNWVRSKLKTKKKKKSTMLYAREVLSQDDFDDFFLNGVMG